MTTTFDPKQKFFGFNPETFLRDPLAKYELLFRSLNTSSLEKDSLRKRGRPALSPASLLRGLIVKNLKAIPTLTDLAHTLYDHRALASQSGLEIDSPQALIERLSSFLKDTPVASLETIRKNLAKELVSLGIVQGKFLAIDSCPIPVGVKENNLKTNVKDRFDKTKHPKADPEARLGVIIHYLDRSRKEERYFWGYRNHVVTDMPSELPVASFTKPADVHETSLFIPLFEGIRNEFQFEIEGVLGDAAYDAEFILRFVKDMLHAKPYIPKNPRNTAKDPRPLSPKGEIICIAGFPMTNWGTFREQHRIRTKFVCPVVYRKSFRKEHPTCPWNHPRFLKGKGCVHYLQKSESIRNEINYHSEHFKKTFRLRTGAERAFSRLLSLSLENPSVRGFQAVANHAAIAHITILLIALTATRAGFKDQYRFVKNFLPNL